MHLPQRRRIPIQQDHLYEIDGAVDVVPEITSDLHVHLEEPVLEVLVLLAEVCLVVDAVEQFLLRKASLGHHRYYIIVGISWLVGDTPNDPSNSQSNYKSH